MRTLAFSIAIYSVFTELQGLSQGIFDFAVYSFIAGLGMGAKLMVRIPLLAEARGETHRAKIAATMMTGGTLGTFIGALAYGLVGPYGWRYVFFVGVVPAIILAVMRGRMLEPERFAGVRERRRAVAAGLRSETGYREFHALCAAAVIFEGVPLQHIGRGAVRPRLAAGDLDHEYLAANHPLADGAEERCRRRDSRGAVRQPWHHAVEPRRHLRRCRVWLYLRHHWPSADGHALRAGTIIFGLILYLALPEFEPWHPRILPIFGFFVFGVFSGYAVYLPELFPTHIRSTAVGVLHRQCPRHHELRPARRRAPGRRVLAAASTGSRHS